PGPPPVDLIPRRAAFATERAPVSEVTSPQVGRPGLTIGGVRGALTLPGLVCSLQNLDSPGQGRQPEDADSAALVRTSRPVGRARILARGYGCPTTTLNWIESQGRKRTGAGGSA